MLSVPSWKSCWSPERSETVWSCWDWDKHRRISQDVWRVNRSRRGSSLRLVSTCKHAAASIFHSAQVDRAIMLKAHLADMFLPKMASSRGAGGGASAGEYRWAHWLIDGPWWFIDPSRLQMSSECFAAWRRSTSQTAAGCNENPAAYSELHPPTPPPANLIFIYLFILYPEERCAVWNWKGKLLQCCEIWRKIHSGEALYPITVPTPPPPLRV